ncbi:sporulation protein [Sulfuricella sp. T08]|uniref:SPOR domain-containing protein n=1 Tax=Sulfuricella sp. T08 TaxID=1632857 RepID=UPI0006179FE3|nr:SPOR domain-containing protein [Sulfuricella sp. T08]GAO35560.1 sporulation protein [Sulfuricella sp. T08]
MPEQPSLDEQNEVKKRAIRRVIVASVLVAAAIAALTVLTRYKSEAPVTRTTAPGTVLPPVTQPEPATPAPEEMAAPPTTLPEQEAQPTPPPPPPPEVVNAPTPGTPAGLAPKAAKPTPVRPGTEAEVSARPAPVKPAAAPPQAATRAPQEMQPAQPAKAISERALPHAEPVPKGYTVQLGVFSNPTNALQLQEKLAQNGIKSYTETRLNVGPFQSKTEADQALAKIRAMGISAVVVPVR